MRIYLDSSALIKRSIEEAESDAADRAIDDYVARGDVLLSSSLAWVEVSRAIRARRTDTGPGTEDAIDIALSGVAERMITDEVIGLARRIAPRVLRSLDAIHLATAILLDVDEIMVYDERLADACHRHGLRVVAPGR